MSAQVSSQPGSAGISAALTFLFAVAGGAAVGNLYWAQPLLGEIAASFGTSTGAAGSLVTVTQIGYAIGVFLIVPLGDVVNRRRLIPAIMLCSAVALAASASAPSFIALIVSLAAVGLTTVTGQLLTPLAGDLAKPEQRGRVVGTVVSGLLTGILLSRTISGFIGDLFGWHAIYWLAAVISAVIAGLLAKALPSDPSRPAMPYRTLLSSVFAVVAKHRAVRVTLLLGATVFSVFTMFWTGLTFLLSSPPFSFSLTQIGLVGLVGLAGALGAQRTGALHDRGWSVYATGAGLALSLASLVIAAVGSTSLIAILLAVLVIDIAIQAVNVLNQTRMFSVDPTARSRLNTAFVTCNFIGGAIGSALAGLLWEAGGWQLIMLGGIVMMAFALTVWAVFRKMLDVK
ncbi:MAG: MFS transporter [Shinella sp.]|nr:MFS transporter [Shinella sp.]